MLNFNIYTVLFVFVFPNASVFGKKYSQNTPKNTISYAIHLLEAKNYERFFRTVVDPEVIGNAKDIQPLITIFKRRKAEELLRFLKLLGDVSLVRHNGDKIRLVYKSTTEVKFKVKGIKSITFKKIRNKWYIAD